MPEYKVQLSQTEIEYTTVYIEADSEEEAREIAENGDWSGENWRGEYQGLNVEEVTEVA